MLHTMKYEKNVNLYPNKSLLIIYEDLYALRMNVINSTFWLISFLFIVKMTNSKKSKNPNKIASYWLQ